MRTTTRDVHAVGDRPSGRRPSPRPLLHAVPVADRTRSALCGARVGGADRPWSHADPTSCPECVALVQGQLAQPA